MNLRKTIIAALLLILPLLLTQCSPYMMKAKMASSDQRYDLAIDFALKHYEGNQGDEGVVRYLADLAAKYHEQAKAEVKWKERLGDWDEIVKFSSGVHARLSRLLRIRGITFPTEAEVALFKQKMERSNFERTAAMYTEGKGALENRDYEVALDRFGKCQDYIPHYKDTDELIGQVRSILAEAQYQKGYDLFGREKYQAALEHFERCLDYQEDYQDALDLARRSRHELARKHYEEGERYSKFGKLKDALAAYTRAVEYRSDYPEALEKLETVRAKLTVRMAVLPFQVKKMGSQFGSVVTDRITSKALARKSEFLVFLDRANIQKVFEEQALSQTGAIDEKTVVDVGKVMGVNTMVTGSAALLSSQTTGVSRTRKTGYRKQSYIDVRGVKREKKVPFNYTSFKKTRSVNVQISYRIIDVETARILESNTVTTKRSDTAEWITCPKEFVSHLPKSERKRIGASKVPKARDELIKEAIEHLAGRIAKTIVSKVDKLRG